MPHFDSVKIVDRPQDLRGLNLDGCLAAIWKREPLPTFQKWINDLEPNQLPKGNMVLKPEDAYRAITGLCALAKLESTEERDMLVGDTAALAHIFSSLAQTEYVRISFGLHPKSDVSEIEKSSNAMRLICTYRGPGTLYQVSETDNRPEHYDSVPTGAPILIRNVPDLKTQNMRLWSKSPPVNRRQEENLVLSIQPATGPEAYATNRLLH